MRVFSLVLCKDSFRIIMLLLAHYDLELHQMDVKTAFFNENLYENVYMAQPKGFVMEEKKTYGMPPVEIHLWVKISHKIVVFEVDKTIRKFGF